MHNIDDYIADLERRGLIDPNCNGCKEFYTELRKGKELWQVFAPTHRAMESCRSGKYNHCTCDTCF